MGSIQQKIVLLTGLTMCVTVALVTVASAITLRERAQSAAERELVEATRGHLSRVEARLDTALARAGTLADTFSGVKHESDPIDLSRENVVGILTAFLQRYDDYRGIFTVWDVDAFDDMDIAYGDTEGHDETGQFIPYIARSGEGVSVTPITTHNSDQTDASGRPASGFYSVPMAGNGPVVIGPWAPERAGGATVITVSVPIQSEAGLYGVVGIDVAVGALNLTSDQPMALLDANGKFIAGQTADALGFPVETLASQAEVSASLTRHDSLFATQRVALAGGVESWNLVRSEPLSTINGEANRAAMLPLGAGAIGLLVATGLIAIVARRISKPLKFLATSMNDIAEGEADLTKRIGAKGKDEIAQVANSFDAILQRLDDFVGRVRESASDVESNATKVEQVMAENTGRVQEQNSSVRSISAAIEELQTSIGEVSAACGDAAASASNAQQMTTEGNAIMQETARSMSLVGTAVESGASGVTALDQSVQEITSLLNVIDDIADQTNLLALNAAIEAARAGENGRGFAVVADEVRKLADHTTTATEEIVRSIGVIGSTAREAIERLDTGRAEVETGTEQASRTSAAFERIEQSSTEAAERVKNISVTAEEQARATRDIADQTERMRSLSEEIEDGGVTMATNVQGMNQATGSLQELLSVYRTTN